MITPGNVTAAVSDDLQNIFDGILDISDLQSVSIHVFGTFSVSLVVEVSNEHSESPENFVEILTITRPGIHTLPLGYRTLRIRSTGYVSGEASVIAVFSREDVARYPDAEEANYSERLDITESYIYEGQAVAGSLDSAPVWRVSRFDLTSYATLWADGDENADNVWDDRATLSYS